MNDIPRTPSEALEHKDHVVVPLQYKNASHAADTFVKAFRDDPLLLYLSGGQSSTPRYQSGQRIHNTLLFLLWISRKIGLTIHCYAGESFLIATPDKETAKPHTPGERVVDCLTDFMLHGFAGFAPEELRKRQKEVESKIEQAVQTSLGDRVHEMIQINALATSPENQGRGYGTALLKALIQIANLTSRAIWLQASRSESVKFYTKNGFRVASTVVIGDQNPEWHEVPVQVYILVKEPKR